jgi:tRNA (guanine37-N1)-methyltransferase
LIKPSECLVDLFCGVGPLAVRAAKKGVFVIANDLNPSCYEYLVNNGKINGVEKKMKCWNLCAREAVRKIWQEHN